MRTGKTTAHRYREYIRDISVIFVMLLPLAVCQAMLLLFIRLLGVGEYGYISNFFKQLLDVFHSFYPIALCIATAYHFSYKKGIVSLGTVIYTLVMYYLISMASVDVKKGIFLPDDALMAIFSGGVTVYYCVLFPLRELHPLRLDFATNLLWNTLNFFCFIILSLLVSLAFHSTGEYLISWSLSEFVNPMSFGGSLIYEFTRGAMWSIGINAHQLMSFLKDNLDSNTIENIAAWKGGYANISIINSMFYYIYAGIGGSGNTLSLLFVILLLAKDKKHMAFALMALPLAFFNINELILFGLPVIFNPIMVIPFILVPILSITIAYEVIELGMVPAATHITDWILPPLLNAYVASEGSISAVILQVLLIIMGMVVYAPFYMKYIGVMTASDGKPVIQPIMEKVTFVEMLEEIQNEAQESMCRVEARNLIHKMMNEGEFTMMYQPQFDMENNHFCAEALVRYRDVEGKLHPPTFINAFLKVGAIEQLDSIVLDCVLEDMSKLSLHAEDRVSINISTETFSSPTFLDMLQDKIKGWGVNPKNIEIEITEEAILEHEYQVHKNIDAVHQLGITVAMDDFGSGYASFPHLLQYPFDKVKFDRSLLLETETKKGRHLYQLLSQISSLGQCKIVAEGVETQQQKEFVHSCGITSIQGFYFQRPVFFTEIKRLMEERQGEDKH